MSKGRRISQEVKDFIEHEAIARPKASREWLANDLADRIEERKYPVPEHDTLKKMISVSRHKWKPGPEDEYWHLGCLAMQNIAPQVLPVMVHVWKLSLAEGRSMTVREAKWAARLQPLLAKPNLLLEWARRYAQQEIMQAVRHQPLDTSDLDAALTMTAWEAATAYAVGSLQTPDFLPMVPSYVRYSVTEPDSRAPRTIQMLAPVPNLDHVWDAIENELFDRWITSWVKPPKLGRVEKHLREKNEAKDKVIQRCRKEFSMSPEAPWVFLYWLRYLRKGPKWSALSRHSVRTLLDGLVEWVSRETSTVRTSRDLKGYDLRYYGLVQHGPARLLKAVGYSIKARKDAPSFEEHAARAAEPLRGR